VVGPERVYGSNGLYKNLLFAFLVGAGLTVLAWAVKRKWPNRITKSINIPVIIAGAQYFGESQPHPT
jgi:putative copper export protein